MLTLPVVELTSLRDKLARQIHRQRNRVGVRMGAELQTIITETMLPAIERLKREQLIVPGGAGKEPFAPYNKPELASPLSQHGVEIQDAGVPSYGEHHNLIEWVFGISGKAELALDGQRYEVNGGDLAVIPMRKPHLERIFERKQSFHLLWFCAFPHKNSVTVHSSSYHGGNRFQLIESAAIDGRHDLCPLYVRSADEALTRGKGWVNLIRATVIEVLVRAVRHLEERGTGLTPVASRGSMVEIAKSYIQAHFSRPLTLKEISKEVFLSPNYFSTLFAQATGSTVFDFVQMVRLDEAQRLLKETRLPVRDVAKHAGFQTAAHFTRSFRQQTGASPREFRRAVAVK
jgi:AraC-like DNA-binding protein